MSIIDNYYEEQFDWLEHIFNQWEEQEQNLPYYLEELKADVNIPALGATLSIRFHRTLNNGKPIRLNNLREDMLFKKASMFLNMGPKKIYYNRIRFYNEKWHISIQDKNLLKSIHEDPKTSIGEDLLHTVLEEIDQVLVKQAKLNPHVPGYIYF